jgi:hypothetical protein
LEGIDEEEELPAGDDFNEVIEEAAGVISSVATGLWGAFFGTAETPKETPKPTPVAQQDQDDLSKKTIKVVKLTVNENLKRIYAEKERIFTDFILID